MCCILLTAVPHKNEITMWVLEIKCGSSARSANVPNYWTTFQFSELVPYVGTGIRTQAPRLFQQVPLPTDPL